MARPMASTVLGDGAPTSVLWPALCYCTWRWCARKLAICNLRQAGRFMTKPAGTQVPLGYYSLFWAPKAIPLDAQPAQFSETRSRQHIQYLSEDLQDRQVSLVCSLSIPLILAVLSALQLATDASLATLCDTGWDQGHCSGSRLLAQ